MLGSFIVINLFFLHIRNANAWNFPGCTNTSECLAKTANTECIDGACDCADGFTKVGDPPNACVDGQDLGQSCNTDLECLANTANSECSGGPPGTCSCVDGFSQWGTGSSAACTDEDLTQNPDTGLGDSCSVIGAPCELAFGAVCTAGTPNNVCACPDGFTLIGIAGNSFSFCNADISLNHGVSYPDDCDNENAPCGDTENSMCSGGSCACAPGYSNEGNECGLYVGDNCDTEGSNCTFTNNSVCQSGTCGCATGYTQNGSGPTGSCDATIECAVSKRKRRSTSELDDLANFVSQFGHDISDCSWPPTLDLTFNSCAGSCPATAECKAAPGSDMNDVDRSNIMGIWMGTDPVIPQIKIECTGAQQAYSGGFGLVNKFYYNKPVITECSCETGCAVEFQRIDYDSLLPTTPTSHCYVGEVPSLSAPDFITPIFKKVCSNAPCADSTKECKPVNPTPINVPLYCIVKSHYNAANPGSMVSIQILDFSECDCQ